jgi:hypothetical protein
MHIPKAPIEPHSLTGPIAPIGHSGPSELDETNERDA